MSKSYRVPKVIMSEAEGLFDRWQEEKEYEDFSDYKDRAKKVTEGQKLTFIGLTKSPFVWKYKDDSVGQIHVKITNTQVTVKLIEENK